MSRLHTPALESAIGPTAQVYTRIRKSLGRVPGDMGGPVVRGAEQDVPGEAAEAVLAGSTVGKQDQETIRAIVSEAAGCDYCLAAPGFEGNGRDSSPGHEALIRFVRNLVETTGTIDPAFFEEIKAAGYTDVELVDISLAVATAVFNSTFNRINDTTADAASMS